MIKIVLFTALILFLSSGLGLFLNDKLNIKDKYSLPLGFMAYLFLLQLFYYPIQYFSLSSTVLMIVSSLISLVLFIYSIFRIKDLIKSYLSYSTVLLIISILFFAYVFYHCSLSLELSDSQVYANFICQNIKIDHLNQFDFWTGKLGDPTEVTYLYQGYYHFASFVCWLINVPYNLFHITGFVENMPIIGWSLGLIYSAVSSAFMLNVADDLKLNKIIKIIVSIFGLFFFNFYYWRVGFAFYGNTYRTLACGMLLYYLYRIYQKKEDISYLVLPVLIGSGLAASSSSLFIMFDMAYVIMAYYYCVKKEEKAFKKLAVIVFPIVIFAGSYLSYYSKTVSIALLLLATIYYLLAYFNNRILNNVLDVVDQWLYKYGKYLLLVLIPLALIIYSFLLNRIPYYYMNYAHYFENHADYDMVVDPHGFYGNWADRISLLIYWLGFVVLCIKGLKKKDFISFFLLASLLIFLTPLTTPAIAKLYSDYVYYRAFDIIFNHFTIILFIKTVLDLSDKKVFKGFILSLLVILTLLMNTTVFNINLKQSSYSYLYKEGKCVDPIFKLTSEDYLVLKQIREWDILPKDHQVTVICQLEGFKTFFPDSYQIFSRRQFYDATRRVNEEFYQIAKRHYGWLDEDIHPDYSNTEKYLKEFNIDIVIVNYRENPEFDNACNTIMTNVMETENYHVKVRNK